MLARMRRGKKGGGGGGKEGRRRVGEEEAGGDLAFVEARVGGVAAQAVQRSDLALRECGVGVECDAAQLAPAADSGVGATRDPAKLARK